MSGFDESAKFFCRDHGYVLSVAPTDYDGCTRLNDFIEQRLQVCPGVCIRCFSGHVIQYRMTVQRIPRLSSAPSSPMRWSPRDRFEDGHIERAEPQMCCFGPLGNRAQWQAVEIVPLRACRTEEVGVEDQPGDGRVCPPLPAGEGSGVRVPLARSVGITSPSNSP